jgi:hypothetical protein
MYRWPDYLLVVAERGKETSWSVGEHCPCTTKHFLTISKTWIVIEACSMCMCSRYSKCVWRRLFIVEPCSTHVVPAAAMCIVMEFAYRVIWSLLHCLCYRASDTMVIVYDEWLGDSQACQCITLKSEVREWLKWQRFCFTFCDKCSLCISEQ